MITVTKYTFCNSYKVLPKKQKNVVISTPTTYWVNLFFKSANEKDKLNLSTTTLINSQRG